MIRQEHLFSTAMTDFVPVMASPLIAAPITPAPPAGNRQAG